MSSLERRTTEPQFRSKRESLRLKKFLGGGSFGNVFEVEVLDGDASFCAIKQVSLEGYKFHFKDEVTPFSKILREVQLLKGMGDSTPDSVSFVVKLLDYWVEGKDAEDQEALNKSFNLSNPEYSSTQPQPPTRNWLFIQMELCQMTLADFFRRSSSQRLQHTVQSHHSIIEGLLRALDFIQNFPPNGIVHRDIKPANIFLSLQPKDRVIVKLGDFGLGRVLREDKDTVTTVTLGSARYKSPEMLKQDGHYDTKTDVFSMGLVLLEVVIDHEGSIWGAESKVKIKEILDNIFDRLQRGEVASLTEEVKSELLQVELEIVNKMTKFDKRMRCSASEALSYYQNQDDFSALLEKERKEARLVRYNVPTPTTPRLYGRNEELEEVAAWIKCSTNNNILIWLVGHMGIGVSEFASKIVHRVKGEMHCIWIEYQDLYNQFYLRSLCSQLGIEEPDQLVEVETDISTEELIRLSRLIVENLAKRDDSATILFIFHDIFYPYEANALAEKIIQINSNVIPFKFLFCSKVIPILSSSSSLKSFLKVLEPIGDLSSFLLMRDSFPQLNVDIDKDSITLEEIGRLTHNTPGLIRRLGEYIASLEKSSNPISLLDTIPLLKYGIHHVLRFPLKSRSFYDDWQTVKDFASLDPWEYKLLQILSISFPEGSADLELLFEIGKKLELVEIFSSELVEQFKDKVTNFCICTIKTDKGAYAGQSMKIHPLIREIINVELGSVEDDNDNNSSLIHSYFSQAAKEKIGEMETSFKSALRHFWEFLVKEDKLRSKYVKEFKELTTNIGGNWEKPPMYYGSRRFYDMSWTKEKFRVLSAELEDPHDVDGGMASVTVQCYSSVFDVVSKGVEKKSLSTFISLRNILLKIEREENNLSTFFLESCSPLISNYIFQKASSIFETERKTIANWIVSEVQGSYERDVDFIIFAFLSILRVEEYMLVVQIGEAVISGWFRIDSIRRESLIVLIYAISIVLQNFQSEHNNIQGVNDMLRKLVILKKMDRPKIYLGMYVWKLNTLDKWHGWFAKALFESPNHQFLLNLALQICFGSSDIQQEFFQELKKNFRIVNKLGSATFLKDRYESILSEIERIGEDLLEMGMLTKFYRNYLRLEVRSCREDAGIQLPPQVQKGERESIIVDTATPTLIALARYGNYPEMTEDLDKLRGSEDDWMTIDRNGHFQWVSQPTSPNTTSRNNNSRPLASECMRKAVGESMDLYFPPILEIFPSVYPHLGGVLAHVLASPISSAYRGKCLTAIREEHVTDERTIREMVVSLGEMLHSKTQYEINTVFEVSIFLCLHICTQGEEHLELFSYLLQTLCKEFRCHYEGRGKHMVVGEGFLRLLTLGKMSLSAAELGVKWVCIGLLEQSWDKNGAIKCLNLLRRIMTISIGVKFKVPIIDGENKEEELLKIYTLLMKLGVGEGKEGGKQFSYNLALVLLHLCLHEKKTAEAGNVLTHVLRHCLEREEFYKMLSLGTDFTDLVTKLVWEEACGSIIVGGNPLSFHTLEEMVKGQVFKVEQNMEVDGDDEDELLI